ncbi:MAG: YIP1 family protein [Pseudomonadota bacterium]
MTVDFQTWMRIVWDSIMEPSDAARKVIAANVSRDTLWTAMALIIVLNVLLVALLQFVAQVPMPIEGESAGLSPFSYTAIFGIFLVLLVFGVHYSGQAIGGVGTTAGSLAVIVWFQAISLTLEAIQVVIVLISPAIASLFGMISLGALIWCFVNFVNVLHGFDNIGKSILVIVLALISTAICSGIILMMFGITTPGGMT